jgi:hypothetical protein
MRTRHDGEVCLSCVLPQDLLREDDVRDGVSDPRHLKSTLWSCSWCGAEWVKVKEGHHSMDHNEACEYLS